MAHAYSLLIYVLIMISLDVYVFFKNLLLLYCVLSFCLFLVYANEITIYT